MGLYKGEGFWALSQNPAYHTYQIHYLVGSYAIF
jgi:hypothetical protein